MATTLTLLRDMYLHVGPGLLLALAMPVSIVLLVVVSAQVVRRVRSVGGAQRV